MKYNEEKLIIFGGKGGTGKTTCASATGLYLAEKEKLYVLIISIDPAHSLSDIFSADLDSSPKKVSGVENLDALELDAQSLMETYKRNYAGYLSTLLERGTYLDDSDISNLLDLPLPGIDEISAVIKINELFRGDKYDVVILDTPPTGQLYNLLDLPSNMVKWIELLDLLAEKHRFIKSSLVGDYPKDDVERFLNRQRGEIELTDRLLTDSSWTRFIPVLNPDDLSYKETSRLFKKTDLSKITNGVIFNGVQVRRKCKVCRSRAKRAQAIIDHYGEDFPDMEVAKVRRYPYSIDDIDGLRKIGDELFSNGRKRFYHLKEVEGDQGRHKYPLPNVQNGEEIALTNRFILFGGKGGTGKTTLSIGSALKFVEEGEEDVIILSIDPAGSLNDFFPQEITRSPVKLYSKGEGSLYGLESEPKKEIESVKHNYQEAIEETVQASTKSTEVRSEYDEQIIYKLFTLIPPGISEIGALVNLLDLIDEEEYDRIVIDAAPTGQMIRFLELPALASTWLSALLDVLIKYRGVIDAPRLARKTLSLSRKVRKLKSALFPDKGDGVELVVVTIPEYLSLRETARLVDSAKEIGLGKIHVVVNKVLRGKLCQECQSERQHQEKWIRESLETSTTEGLGLSPYLPGRKFDKDDLIRLARTFLS